MRDDLNGVEPLCEQCGSPTSTDETTTCWRCTLVTDTATRARALTDLMTAEKTRYSNELGRLASERAALVEAAVTRGARPVDLARAMNITRQGVNHLLKRCKTGLDARR